MTAVNLTTLSVQSLGDSQEDRYIAQCDDCLQRGPTLHSIRPTNTIIPATQLTNDDAFIIYCVVLVRSRKRIDFELCSFVRYQQYFLHVNKLTIDPLISYSGNGVEMC